MSSDTESLRRYVEQHSESAFADLVREHLNLVYSAALREMNGDRSLAEEIAQEVFTALARNASRLLNHPSLAGWLYTTVRHTAANSRRADQRRRRREEQVMNELLPEESPDPAWRQIRPVLDDALHELKEADRVAVVLRFLENRSLREVGVTLGLHENAARMRVERALEKLRGLLARRGITSTASGLAAALALGVITPAPDVLAGTIAAAAAAKGVAAGSTFTLIKLMSLTKFKVAMLGALVIAGAAVPVVQQTRLQRVQAENAQLHAQEAESRAHEAELAALRTEIEGLRKIEADHTELERLRQYQVQTQPELLRLRNLAGVARRASAEAEQLRAQLARQTNEPGTNLVAGAMVDAMQQAVELQVEARLGRMAASLHLTPEQIQAARDILLRQAQVMKRIFAGNFNMEDMAAADRTAGNPEQQLQALLTPEQHAAYPAYQQEEAAYNARQAANGELLQIEATLALSPDQADRAYAVLYDQSLNQLTGRDTPASTNQAELVQWFLDQKAKALEPVLTPAQLETYQRQQAAQAKLAKDIVSRMTSNASAK